MIVLSAPNKLISYRSNHWSWPTNCLHSRTNKMYRIESFLLISLAKDKFADKITHFYYYLLQMMCLRTWSISAKKQYWTQEKNLQKITYGNLNLEKKRFYSLWSWWDLWIYEWGRLIPMNGLSGCMEVKGVICI